jgi:catechol 2,3-dioxygenase-like lactoylglutathione lyase family enzyme
MPTRLTSVVIDSADPPILARWWATALGWEVTYEDDDESDVEPPAGQPGIELTFVPVDDERVVKNRVHLDLRSDTRAGQDELIRRLMAGGATEVDIDQGDVPWAVLADPEGNEFCVLEPRPEYAGTGALASIVVDVLDPAAMAAFWTEAAGWPVRVHEDEYSLVPPGGRGPWLEFVPTGQPHAVKNRVHLDVAPFADDDQAADVARLLKLGARRTEVGQSDAAPGQVTWVVLADPEDNEFCVLSSR